MTSTNSYIDELITFNPLIVPVIEQAIDALKLPENSNGLDAGCGAGLHTVLFAKAIGDSGRVTGLDISSDFTGFAEDYVARQGLSGSISFKVGDVTHPPFEDDTFDWVWSSDCVGYAPTIEPVAAVAELARVTKPGGKIALFAWSSETLLPGYPELEAKLKATTAGIAPFTRGMKPERHFIRAMGWFRELGFKDIEGHTLVSDFNAPLQDDIRKALVSLFEMRWTGAEDELSVKDRKLFESICTPESSDFILDNPDYYGFITCSMFSGEVPE